MAKNKNNKDIYDLIKRTAKGVPYIYSKQEIRNWTSFSADNLKIDTRNTERVNAEEEQALLNGGYHKFYNNLPILKHKYSKNLYLNLVYKSTCYACKNDEFIVLKVIYIKKSNKTLLEINFLNTFRNLIIPLSVFKSKNIYNPCTNIFFNGVSLGNVNILDYPDEFYCWYETINRTFNPNNPICRYFQKRGFYITTPFSCFESLVLFNDQRRYRDPECIITDPNDRLLYIDLFRGVNVDSKEAVALLHRLKYLSIEGYPVRRLTLRENYASLEERKHIFKTKHPGGRPKKQPQEKLLYKLI